MPYTRATVGTVAIGVALVTGCGSSSGPNSNTCTLTLGPNAEAAGVTVRYLYAEHGDAHIASLTYVTGTGGSQTVTNPVSTKDSTYEQDEFFQNAGQAELTATGTYATGHWNISVVDGNGQLGAQCPPS